MLNRLVLAAGLAAAMLSAAFAQADKLPVPTDAAKIAVAKHGAHPGQPIEQAAIAKDAPKVSVKHAIAPRSPRKVDPVKRVPLGLDSGIFHPSNVVALTVRPAGCLDTTCTRTYLSHNARVNNGASAIAQDIGGTPVAAFKFVALSTDATAVAATDPTCPSEITTNGLARNSSTFTAYTAPVSLGASASYTMTDTWSPTATVTIAKICMLNAASAGTLGFEDVLGVSVTVNSGDVLNLSWVFNI